ncbi:unnamed protein product [Trichobilharzia regenti]|nr:unnamed protein product [Trichobilharzia regenti]
MSRYHGSKDYRIEIFREMISQMVLSFSCTSYALCQFDR